MRVSGISATEDLCEMIELPDHPWFVACQFHPEFTSTPRGGHPLFAAFIRAGIEHGARRGRRAALSDTSPAEIAALPRELMAAYRLENIT
jgi:hypothetical protein